MANNRQHAEKSAPQDRAGPSRQSADDNRQRERRRHVASYAARLRGDRGSFYNKLHRQLQRRIPAAKGTVSRKTVNHVWRRHGCYQNAKQEQGQKRNRGKMPSYFRNHRTLVNAVAETVKNPNWTRTAEQNNPKKNWRGKKHGYTIPRRGRPNSGYWNRMNRRSRRDQQKRNQTSRRLHFKLFRDYIGYSGRGYGSRPINTNDADDLECYCCCVVMEGKTVITAFPILTTDAERKGIGAKNMQHDSVDDSKFDSDSKISSSDSLDREDEKENPDKTLKDEPEKDDDDETLVEDDDEK